LEKYIIADDVQVVDVAPLYGLLSVQGPQAESIIRGIQFITEIPRQQFGVGKFIDSTLGEVYLINQPRLLTLGYDIFVPVVAFEKVAQELVDRAQAVGGRLCGWEAFETARIETGIPRFGADIDETNIPLEARIEERAISFKKGCYIGQEVISRIKTYGQVTRSLRGLVLKPDLGTLPRRGDKLFHSGKEVGYLTSAIASPAFKTNIALGYVRKETNQIGTVLTLQTSAGETEAQIVKLPFSDPLY
jgi:folate-binding protein YgfZ